MTALDTLLNLAQRAGLSAVLVALVWGAAVVSVALLGRRGAARTPRQSAPSFGAVKTVLVAEDESSSAAAIVRALEHEVPGVAVSVVNSAAEAERILTSPTPPALAILDCYLKDGNGWEVAAKAAHRTAVVLTSGVMDPEMLRRLAASVGAAHLPKPFALDELVRVVRAELEKQAA